MKTKFKFAAKFIAVFLTLLLVFEIIPMQVVAESADKIKTVTESNKKSKKEDAQNPGDKVLDENNNVKILCEDNTKREEYVKHFRMSDGTYQAVMYEMPVHIEKDGEWIDYNNTLSEVASDDSKLVKNPLNKDLINNFGDYTVRFSKKSNGNKLVRLSKDGCDLSWTFSDSNKKTAKVLKNGNDGDETTLENLTSQVVYEGLYNNTDLQYIVMPEQLKENIILKDKSVQKMFSVEYKTNKLSPYSVDDKTIILQNNSGETVFTLSAPFMYDSAGEISEGITLTLSNVKENSFIVTMILDSQWLDAEDRAFPVTVDPAIKTEQDRNEMTSTFVASGDPNKSFGQSKNDAGSMYVGNNIYKYGNAKAYIKINNLPYIGGIGSKVIGAQLAVCKRNVYSTTNNVVINAHRVTSAWDKQSLKYNNQPSCDSTIADYMIVNADNKIQNDYHDNYIYPEFKSIDITKLVYSWYEGTSPNYGIMLETQQTNTHKVWFHSIEYTTYPTTRPVLSVAYRNMSGFEDYWSYTSMPAGRNGTANVNNFNGNLVFTQPLTQDLGGNLMPVAVSLVYNSNRDNSIYNARLGNGMQMNYNICLIQETGKLFNEGYKYYLIDADGTRHWFYFENNGNTGKDEDGLGYTLDCIENNSDSLCAEARYRITDKDKNKMYFDSSKRIIQFTNANGVSSKVAYYELGNGQFLLSNVYDGAGREYKFFHDFIDNTNTYYLKRIEDPAGRCTYFDYTDGCLTSITFPDGKSISLVHQYESYKFLNRITDIDGNRVNIEYDWTSAFRVRSFSNGDFNGNLPVRYQFAYYPNETTVQAQHAVNNNIITDNTYTYQFNNFGQNIGIVSNKDGEAQYFDYQNSNGTNSKTSLMNNKVVSQSKVIKSVTNLIKNQGFRDGMLYFTAYNSDASSGATINTNRGYLDNNAVEFTRAVNGLGDSLITADFLSLAPGDYTFSGYITTDNNTLSNGGTFIGIKKWDDSGAVDYIKAESVTKTEDWQRFTVSVTVDPNDKIRLFCGLEPNAYGTFYADNLQFEKGMGASSYNLLQNSDASNSTYAWESYGSVNVSNAFSEYQNSLTATGSPTDGAKGIWQYAGVSGKKGDVFSIGAWVSARSVPTTSGLKPNDPKFGIALYFYNSAGQNVGVKRIDANPEVTSWQFVSGKAIAPEDYARVCFEVYYYNNANNVYTTGTFCYKEEFGQTYTYDNNGNIVSSVDLAKSNSTFGYQGNNLAGMINPSGSSYLYSYDSSNNINTAFSTDGLKYYLEYDDKGNLTQTATKGVNVTHNEIDTSKKYAIVNQLTSYVLDKGDNGDVVNHTYSNIGNLQQWEFERIDSGIYKIKLNGEYLYVENGSSEVGAKLKLRSQNTDSYAFKFVVLPTDDGSFVISTVASPGMSYYLDSTDGSSFSAEVNSVITQRPLRTPKNTSQKWYLIEDYSSNESEKKKLYSSATYTDDKNYLKTQTDQANNTTTYNYDTVKGTLSSVTNAAGNTTTYNYDSDNNNLLSVSAGGHTNTYSYNNDRLTGINVNNSTHYEFNYDKFGRTVSTSVGNGTNSVILSALEYDQKGLMTKQTYGNRDYVDYCYDSLDRLLEKSYNDRNNNFVAKKQYLYGNDGNIAVTVDFASNSYTRYNYDLSGRTASIREYSGTDVSSNIPISYTEYKYADKTNYLTNVKHFSPIGTQNIAYNYGNVIIGQMPDQVYSVSWNGVEKVTNKFDSLSRLSKRTVNGLATNYTYKDIGENQTTTLVKSIETVGITHTYEYDSLGNITSIYDGSKTTTYKYDALNQLVRADNPYENKTHIYTYENGNITEDKVYQYTVSTSEPSDLKYTVKYSYSNEKWADVLTGVERIFPQDSVNTISLEQEETPEIVTRLLGENAQRYDMESRLSLSNNISALSNSKNEYYAVTSDEIGNITSYDGLNYTWVGRQLKSVSPVGNPSVGTTYSYNSDGQRIGKNITLDDGETYDYDYYYNGDILAGYKLVITNADGSSTTHNVTFMYDENGEAFGFNYNGNDYYYVRNAQNDVIFISKSDNTGVVMYQYDAWGNMTACYDTSDDGMLSIVNPYAYRGYFYEFETNTYFLKSRYYNPELCRFISADGIVNANQDILGNNLYAYCSNNPVNFYDDDGESSVRILTKMIPVALLSAGIVALLQGAVVVSAVIVVGAVVSVIPWDSVSNKVVNARKRISVSRSISKSIKNAMSQARTKIRNEKSRFDYWIAKYISFGNGFGTYIPTTPISYSNAISYVRSGGSVFADSRSNAYKLAKAVGYNRSPTSPERHSKNGSSLGYWWHYHANNHLGGHIFYV